MVNVEKRYEKQGSFKPCTLHRKDIAELSGIIEETYTGPEKERYFRVSTTLGNNRIFSSSIELLFNQRGLPPLINDLSFWIEGWDQQTRFDKNILLDFSRYAIQLSVEGTDPVWVYDKYGKISKYLSGKTSWYWPMILIEKYLIFLITFLLVINLFISFSRGEMLYYLDDLGLLLVWTFLVFSDTRKVWPYASLRIREPDSMVAEEDVIMASMILLLAVAIVSGTIFPLLR